MVKCNFCGKETTVKYLKRHQLSMTCLKIQKQLIEEKKHQEKDETNMLIRYETKTLILQNELKMSEYKNSVLQKQNDDLTKQIDNLTKQNNKLNASLLKAKTTVNNTINNTIINNTVPLTDKHIEDCTKQLKLKHLTGEDSIARFFVDPLTKGKAFVKGNQIGTRNLNGDIVYTPKGYHIKKLTGNCKNMFDIIDANIEKLEKEQKGLNKDDDDVTLDEYEKTYDNITKKVEKWEKTRNDLTDILEDKETTFKANITKIYVNVLDNDNIDTAMKNSK